MKDKEKTRFGKGSSAASPGNEVDRSLTERPDLEDRLFTSIFLSSPIGIYIAQQGRFVFVNPEFSRIAGYEEDELLNMESWRIVVPEDRERVRLNAVKMLKRERTSPYIFRAANKMGEIRWVIESVTSIRYGGKRAVLGYFMDNTIHEQAKEALALSEEKFHKAFRSSPDWFVISTLEDGFYIDVNEAFLRSSGYSREEVIGHTSLELGIWADPQVRSEMVRDLRYQGAVRNMEVCFRMKSGRTRIFLWSAEVIDYGEEKCLIAQARDITDRKRVEEERLKREKLQGVLEMAGAACHELNQPLQAIFILLNEGLEEKPEMGCLQEIKTQFNHIREIIHKVQNIAIYQATNYVMGSKIVDIHKSFKEK